MKRLCVLIVAWWCVCLTATLDWAQVVKAYTRYGKGNSSGEGYSKIGGSRGAECGPPNYCAYTGRALAELPTGTDMGGILKNGNVFYDTSLPSANPSPVVRCTDQAVEPSLTLGNQSKSAGLGGSGAAEQLWNTDSSLLTYNTSGGAHHIVPFNTSTLSCGVALTLAQGEDVSGPGVKLGNASTATSFGAGSFSWNDRRKYYGGGTTQNGLPGHVFSEYTIDPATGNFARNSNFLDMSYGYPIGGNAPTWRPATHYDTGDYVSYTLSLGDWSSTRVYGQGDLILPTTNNPLHCAFKVMTLGSRGTSPAPPTAWSAMTDETCNYQQNKPETGTSSLVWRNIGNDGTFTYQLTSVSGTSGSSTPAWAPGGNPDLNATVYDGSLTWKNVGTMIAQKWSSFSGISKDTNRFCSAYSSNTYGHPTHYANDQGGQGTGIYIECYDFALNKFVLLNTLTGIQSATTCTGGTGYACTGGTLALKASGAAFPAITGSCNFELHNAKGGSTLDYIVISKQGNVSGTCPRNSIDSDNENLLAWQPFTTPFNSTSSLQWFNATSNHWTIGKKLFVNVGDQSVLGYTSGAYTTILNADAAGGVPMTSWQVSPCAISWTPGSANPPCNFAAAYDSHTALWHGPRDDDTGPVCGTMFNYATLAPDPVAPYQGEEVCISTHPNWNPGDPIGASRVWRFTHTFATGGNAFFDTQFAISQLSQDGRFLAFSSDWNCTLGSTAGIAESLCGPPWVAGTRYATGQMINPFGATTGSGTNYGVYQVTTGGVASATKPAWFVCNSTTAGNTVTDSNGVVYTCMGTNNGKGEVFIVGLK